VYFLLLTPAVLLVILSDQRDLLQYDRSHQENPFGEVFANSVVTYAGVTWGCHWGGKQMFFGCYCCPLPGNVILSTVVKGRYSCSSMTFAFIPVELQAKLCICVVVIL